VSARKLSDEIERGIALTDYAAGAWITLPDEAGRYSCCAVGAAGVAVFGARNTLYLEGRGGFILSLTKEFPELNRPHLPFRELANAIRDEFHWHEDSALSDMIVQVSDSSCVGREAVVEMLRKVGL